MINMARPRSNSSRNKGKGTCFGKRSDAEKSFRTRTHGSRSGRVDPTQSPRSFGGDSKSFRGKPSGYKKRDDPGPGDDRKRSFNRGQGKPGYQKREDSNSGEGRKHSFNR